MWRGSNRVKERNTGDKATAKQSEDQREGMKSLHRKKSGVRWKVGSEGSEVHKEKQKFNSRPCFKQRGLFSDRDPSQETELENRLKVVVQVAP